MVTATWRCFFLTLLSVSTGVLCAQDTTAPTVAIASLTNQQPVGGRVQVAATASDDVGVAAVKFYKDQMLVDTDTSAPYMALVDFNADAPNKAYQIRVVVSDDAGNETSAAVTVRKPGDDFRPPGCTLADDGAFFKVWAPHAQSVALIGDFNAWDRADHALSKRSGWWFGFEPGVTPGQKYRFSINGMLDRADPYGRQMEHSAGASIVRAADGFSWSDTACALLD